MKRKLLLSLFIIVLASYCGESEKIESDYLGKFDKSKDLYLAHFDVKTDVDDLHSVAAVATMLKDRRFEGVTYHAIAGAYGIQEGLYVPCNDLFELAFGSNWSDAHNDFNKALIDAKNLASKIISDGGTVWIAEGGQSDFSAALVREIQKVIPNKDLHSSIHIVQHAEWNEEVTSPEELEYVQEFVSYHKIPDGNSVGNGSPGFRSDQIIEWQKSITDPHLKAVWQKAIAIGNKYNGIDGRYLNESIKKGGLDFSDACETAWIFGFDKLVDANDFFREFASDISE